MKYLLRYDWMLVNPSFEPLLRPFLPYRYLYVCAKRKPRLRVLEIMRSLSEPTEPNLATLIVKDLQGPLFTPSDKGFPTWYLAGPRELLLPWGTKPANVLFDALLEFGRPYFPNGANWGPDHYGPVEAYFERLCERALGILNQIDWGLTERLQYSAVETYDGLDDQWD